MDSNVGVIEETKTESDQKVKHYPRFKVIIHNDPITTMQFVMQVLIQIFRMDVQQAHKVMMEAHKTDRAICGIYPFEVAELKQEQVKSMARAAKFPLSCTLEPE